MLHIIFKNKYVNELNKTAIAVLFNLGLSKNIDTLFYVLNLLGRTKVVVLTNIVEERRSIFNL